MTAENVPPPPHGDAGRLDEAGAGFAHPAPAGPRRCTLNQIEQALDAIVDFALHDPSSVYQREAELIEAMTPTIVAAIWSSHHYRTRGHQEIPDVPEYLEVTSWVDKYYALAADDVVKWIDL